MSNLTSTAPTPGITYAVPPADACWVLSGPPGFWLDALLMVALAWRLKAEAIVPGQRYRIFSGSREGYSLLEKQREQVAKIEGHSLEREKAPDGVCFALAPPEVEPSPRSVVVHGKQSSTSIARAVDLGLSPKRLGDDRWIVSGPAGQLLAWVSKCSGQGSVELAQSGWGPEVFAAEASNPVQKIEIVAMPDRVTTSEITRDKQTGDITSTKQTERDAT